MPIAEGWKLKVPHNISQQLRSVLLSIERRLNNNQSTLPVGSLYFNASVSTNPNTLLGYGTWAAFGAGKVPVGFDDGGDTDFDALEETGGAKTHALTSGENGTHAHTQDSHNHTQDSHNHTQSPHLHSEGSSGSYNTDLTGGTGVSTLGATAETTAVNQASTATNQAATATEQNSGSGTAHNNMQPYITVAVWKRTA